MKRFHSYHSLNIFTLVRSVWEFPEHKHNHYELIFIEEGTGTHTINSITFSYSKGDVYLLTPEDVHEFVIYDETVFVFIKFTEQLFIEKLEGKLRSKWTDIISPILLNPNSIVSKSIINNSIDQGSVFSLLKILQVEYNRKSTYGRETLLELFGALLVIIARNINSKSTVESQNESDKINEILSFIRLNIFNRELTSIQYLAEYFSMSPNYISIYIKKNTGNTIQQHINQTKVKSAEQLLQQSKLNINEISCRLGFNDASHFNKFFKKYKGVTPSLFVKLDK